ncbi:hypothetical protein LguiA_016225 [Lonicera macranthoides]
MMKLEDSVSPTSSSSEISITKFNLSPKSAIRRLYRKLSTWKSQSKRSLPMDRAAEVDFVDREYCNNLIRRVFTHFDEDGDGKISAAELESCVRTVGGEITPEEAELAVRSSDSDGDGKLGLEDFAKLMEASGEEERNYELKEAFGMYAMEGSERITPMSLKRMLSRLGESTSIDNCKAMIRQFDLNGDGVLTFDEFSIMMH